MKNKKIYVLMVCLAVVLTGCGLNLVNKLNAPEVNNKETQQTKRDKIENITTISKNSATSTRAGSEECAPFLNPLNQGSLEKCLYNKFSTSTITNGVLNISKRNIFAKQINKDDISEIRYKRVEIQNLYGEEKWGLILISPEGQEYLIPENLEYKILDAVASPYKKDLIFVSGSSLNDACINKLYSYNLATKELIEFYSETRKAKRFVNTEDAGGICGSLDVIGFQGSKLILSAFDSEYSGAICDRVWASDYFGKPVYIDLANINGGLKKFIVPKLIEDRANKEVKECSANIDKFTP